MSGSMRTSGPTLTLHSIKSGITSPATRWGVAAVLAMASVYVGVLVLASGADHLRTQWSSYWWLLLPLWLMSGAQVSMLSHLHRRQRRGIGGTALSAGSGTVGMLACCAHHAAELLPIIGIAGVASALVAWQERILVATLLISVVTTASMLRQWHSFSVVPHPTTSTSGASI